MNKAIRLGINNDIKLVLCGEQIDVRYKGEFIDNISEKEASELVDFLIEFQNRPKTKYFLWKGDHGTIVSHLTAEEDLPSITVGGGGKREQFKPISSEFIKDKFGNFRENN